MKGRIVFFIFIMMAVENISAQYVLPGYNGIWTYPSLNGIDRRVAVMDLIPRYQDKLDIMRNEIYARYGRPFSNPKYKEYFSSQSWYVEKSNFSESWLTEEDKRLVDLIVSIEKPPCYDVINEAKMNNIIYTGTSCDLLFPQFTLQTAAFRWHSNEWGEERFDNRLWIVVGDWLIIYKKNSDGLYQTHDFRIISETKKVGDKGINLRFFGKTDWEDFLSSQEAIKLQYLKNW
jgi:hypothetical protein